MCDVSPSSEQRGLLVKEVEKEELRKFERNFCFPFFLSSSDDLFLMEVGNVSSFRRLLTLTLIKRQNKKVTFTKVKIKKRAFKAYQT